LSADFGREVLDLLIEASYLAAIFLVPLWFAYFFPTYNIFEFNKLIVFKILVWLLFLFTSLKITFFYSRLSFPLRSFFKKYWLWPAVFIAGLSSTLLFSDNLLLSFYGTIERQGGLISYLYYFFWFILVSFNLLTVDNHLPRAADSKDKKIRRVLATAVISAALVSVYGILQVLNIDFISWPEAPFLTHRTFSTFGQPNFLASWLLLVIPLSLYLGYSSRRFLVRFFYFLVAAMEIICLAMTGSRGGLLALFFAGGLYLIYFFFTAAWSRRRKFFVGISFVLISVVSLLSVNKIWPGRISDIFDYKSGSVGARANFYSAAADAIRERPIFGRGLESGNDIFIKYYEPDWAVYGDVGQSADRAHNLIFDTLLSVGSYGLILFLVLYYFFFSLAKDNIKKKNDLLSLALALGAAAYLFSLLFSFAIAAGEIYFWFFLALLAVINHKADGTAAGKDWAGFFARLFRRDQAKISVKILMAAALLTLSFWQIFRSLQSLAADYYFNKIYFTLAKPDYFTALTLDSYLKEQRTNPINQAAYDYFWGEKLSEFYPAIDELAIKKVVTDKMREVEASLPDKGYKNMLVKAKINNALGNYTLAQIYLDRVIEIAPHWPLAYLERGRASVSQKDFQKALVAYNMALLNLPSITDERLNLQHLSLIKRYQYFIYYNIGNIYEREKNYSAAGKYFRLAYQSDPDDYSLLKRIADMEYRLGNLLEAIAYTERGLMRNPLDYRWHVALAALYYESGDQKSAINHIEQALMLAPDDQEIINLKKSYGK
jgi:O-antigen ligase/Tfp pilus assembly protein PilF